MPTVSLPIGLPSGTNPESEDVKVIPADSGAGTTDLLWTVPGGEVWLVTAVTAKVTTVAPGTSNGYAQYLDQDNNIVYWAQHGNPVTAPAIYWQSAAINEEDATVPASNVGASAFRLPYYILQPGWSFDFGIGFIGGGSALFNTLNHFATVTFWDYGAGGSAGGGAGGTIAVGPALYVPGPTFDTEAA